MRVLVCGSNYGRTYIAALARNPRKYQLAGILARGSFRSHEVAALNDVPLYHSTDEVPDNIHSACTAMSSDAWPVVLQLIRRGIHVLCEHPYPPRLLRRAMDLARNQGVQFHVNGHFASLPAPSAFIRACRRIGKRQTLEFGEVMTTERALYTSLDILMSALGSHDAFRARVLSHTAKFVLLEATLGTTPLRLSVQVSGKQGRGRLADGSPEYLLDQRLTVAFPTGVLTLLSTAGPVLWNGNPARMLNDEEPLWTVLFGQEPQAPADLREERVQANVAALNSIRRSILGHVLPDAQQPQHILAVSKAWEVIGRQLTSPAAPPAT
jgi:thiazolinyl imide reductase